MSKLIKYIVSAAAALALSACSDEMPRGTEVNEEGFHVYKLDMDIAFDDEEGSRAAHQWKSSEYVYINFNTGDTPTWGYAYYNTSYDTWNLYMVTELPENVRSGECTCWFFSNNYQHSISTSTEQINLNYDQIPYQAETTFTLVNDKVSISAKLNPVMGRVKLRSTRAWSSLTVSEIYVPKRLDLTKGKLIIDRMSSAIGVNNYDSESGYYYSDYINACYPEDETDRILKIDDNYSSADNIFARSFSDNKNMLAAGTSGYIDVPTPESHEGWVVDTRRMCSASYTNYGDANELSPETNTYYFHTVQTLESYVGVTATISYRASSVYSGSEMSKKTAMLYIEVFDGSPDESSKPLTQSGIYLYQPDSGKEVNSDYSATLSFMLPLTVKTNKMPYYRASILTDGVQIYLTSFHFSNYK